MIFSKIFFRKAASGRLIERRICTGLLLSVFSILLIFSNTVTAKAEGSWPADVEVAGDAVIVMDADTGTVLYGKNEHDEHYPASITKVMTGLLAAENGNLQDTVTYSEDAIYKIERGSSSIARDVGEQMTLEQCLYAMMLESCNSSAYAIAEHIGGTYDNFIKMMNDKAKELGCQNTHFNNSNGLPDENHYTSCYDMALIARAAYNNDIMRKVTGTRTYTIPPTNKHTDPTFLNNHHEMLHYYKTSKYLYDYCVGGKTGYTVAANCTLVTFAKKDNMSLVCVVMNEKNPNQYLDTTNLFNYCFDNFQVLSVKDNASFYQNSDSWDLGKLASESENIKISDDGKVIIPKAANFSDLTSQIIPAKKGTQNEKKESVLGTIEYSYADRMVGSAEITAEKKSGTDTEYPFHESTSGDINDGKFVRVDFRIIILIILLIIAAAALIFIWIKSKNNMTVKPVKNRKHHKRATSFNFRGGKKIRKRRRRKKKPNRNAYAHDMTSTDTHSDNYVKIKKNR